MSLTEEMEFEKTRIEKWENHFIWMFIRNDNSTIEHYFKTLQELKIDCHLIPEDFVIEFPSEEERQRAGDLYNEEMRKRMDLDKLTGTLSVPIVKRKEVDEEEERIPVKNVKDGDNTVWNMIGVKDGYYDKNDLKIGDYVVLDTRKIYKVSKNREWLRLKDKAEVKRILDLVLKDLAQMV